MQTNDAQDLWETLRKGLANHLPERTFHDWIEPCRPLSFDGTTLLIQVPSPSARIWIEQQLAEEFHDVLVQCDLASLRLGFMVAGDAKTAPAPAKGRPAVTAPAETPLDSPFPQGFQRYTLDRFVVGPSSQLAFAAANAVVENHGRSNSTLNMNPLFIYGGSGLGKTHLMIGIGKGILAKSPGVKVAYLKVDNFFNELTIAIRAKNTEPMRKKYQQNDLLLLDDVQTLGRMERTQEEIFYILEYLLQYGKQIVITSDKPPQKLEGLHDRLITRCKWGLTADIQPPDFETRVAILRKKLEDEVFKDLPHVPEDVITFIAHKAKGSVRDLEGLLTRVVFQSSFLGVAPSLDVAQQAFMGQTGSEATASISMEKICRTTAETYGISFTDLMKKKSRHQSILLPRQVAMYLTRELTAASFTEIGRNFNDMHHSTVMNAIESVKNRMQKDADFHKLVHSLLNSIQ
ncbi:chromosomal replication initiator protein DnaA [Mesoterricola sediminis]|uniref:Chromosomal replication initiator protein DnaA n=1 Tax=Mesoterricola sediminis TaxID=2927980 RepID=A0AA48H2Y1_9BACT|nr:chromosomal replication initiator protein DnaA [Mesoterricola sediminis]BDU75043.1 chromosomal replication initiation protein DnaA [Mesoterricola sediminis]